MVSDVMQASKRQRSTYTHTRESFMDVYYILREELMKDPVVQSHPTHAKEWFQEVLDYNVPGGKLNRGMAVYDVLAAIKGAEALAEADVLQANALGWCIEWLQAFFLVADDIMDGSITRRGQPCWYKQEKVGMIACNDYILLECCIFKIIKQHMAGHPGYLKVMELFHEVTYQTAHGQLLDLTTAPQGRVDLSKYTLDTYMRIVTYKTAYYSFYLPVACGMVLAGITDPQAYATAEDILLDMGRYFQIQDDYLDCYGDPEVIGKIGTDIEDNKCSWLICTALQHASQEQQDIIKAHYGASDPASVAHIKELYEKLDLEAKFKAYEAQSYATLSQRIAEQTALPRLVFTSLLDKIYKRCK
uniref:Geranylgeranyl pyrophosphate synthase GGPPS3-3 n=1 Tax=Haematococcus lacustris TaxID=44745 RepID=A0A6B9QJV7_HAELA|nr:geranylgeranyl pyrophosphate synthase GGPPS3-3 [Haematococcus lacustris]